MCLHSRLARQRAVDAFARDVGLDVPMSFSPTEGRADTLAHLATDLRLAGPNWRQHPQHVFAPDAVDRHVADGRECVPFQLLKPIRRDPGVTPTRPIGRERRLGRRPKGRHPGLALRRQRAAPSTCQPSVLECRLACFGKCRERPAAQPNIAALAVDGESLNPRLRTTARHAQKERTPVALHAGLGERPNLRGCQLRHVSNSRPDRTWSKRDLHSLPHVLPNAMCGIARESLGTVNHVNYAQYFDL